MRDGIKRLFQWFSELFSTPESVQTNERLTYEASQETEPSETTMHPNSARFRQIEKWIDELWKIAPGKPPIDATELEVKWNDRKVTEMVGLIKEHCGVRLKLTVASVKSGGINAPAWVKMPLEFPLFGTPGHNEVKATMYIRKTHMTEFEPLVLAISHEMSHIVLNSVRHKLRGVEDAVDLTAMLLGFRDFYITGSRRVIRSDEGKVTEMLGYLSYEEILHAAMYMTKKATKR